jgi:hypothetical protein
MTDPASLAKLREEWEEGIAAYDDKLDRYVAVPLSASPRVRAFVERLFAQAEAAERELEAERKNGDAIAAKSADDTWEQADALYKPQVEALQARVAALLPSIEGPDNLYAAMSTVLMNHTPRFSDDNRKIRCACGWEEYVISAKAWNRHAAAMIANLLLERARALPAGDQGEAMTPSPDAVAARLVALLRPFISRWDHLNLEGVPDRQKLNFEPAEFRSGNHPNYPTVGELRAVRTALASADFGDAPPRRPEGVKPTEAAIEAAIHAHQWANDKGLTGRGRIRHALEAAYQVDFMAARPSAAGGTGEL